MSNPSFSPSAPTNSPTDAQAPELEHGDPSTPESSDQVTAGWRILAAVITMAVWAGISLGIIHAAPKEGLDTLFAIANDGGKVDFEDVMAVVINSYVLWAAGVAVFFALVAAFWTAIGNPSRGKNLMFNQMLALLSALMAGSAGAFAIPSVVTCLTGQ